MRKIFLISVTALALICTQGCTTTRYVYCVPCEQQDVIVEEPVVYYHYYEPILPTVTWGYGYGTGWVSDGSFSGGGASNWRSPPSRTYGATMTDGSYTMPSHR